MCTIFLKTWWKDLFYICTQFSIECIQIWSHNIWYLESVPNMSKKDYSKCFKFGDCTKTCAWCRAAPPQLQAGDEVGLGGAGDNVDLGQVMMTMVMQQWQRYSQAKVNFRNKFKRPPPFFWRCWDWCFCLDSRQWTWWKTRKHWKYERNTQICDDLPFVLL